MLLVLGPHFESHWPKSIMVIPFPFPVIDSKLSQWTNKMQGGACSGAMGMSSSFLSFSPAGDQDASVSGGSHFVTMSGIGLQWNWCCGLLRRSREPGILMTSSSPLYRCGYAPKTTPSLCPRLLSYCDLWLTSLSLANIWKPSRWWISVFHKM